MKAERKASAGRFYPCLIGGTTAVHVVAIDAEVAHLIVIAKDLGLCRQDWQGPEVRVRRTDGGQRVAGTGAFWRIWIYPHEFMTAGDLYETIAHELAHALTPGDGHGLRFRTTLHSLLAERWGIEAGPDLVEVPTYKADDMLRRAVDRVLRRKVGG